MSLPASKQQDHSSSPGGSLDEAHGAAKADAWLWALVVGFVAFVSSVRVLGFGLAYDDFWTIVDNHFLHGAHVWADLFDGTAASLARPDAGRPAMVLLNWMEWRLFGGASSGYHVVGLLWHVGAAVLLFFLVRELLGRLWASVVAGVLFAVLPVHAEVIAVPSFGEDSLVCVLATGWWLSLLHNRRRSFRLRMIVAPLVSLLLLAAVMSKESAAVALVAVPFSMAVLSGRGLRSELRSGSVEYVWAAAGLAAIVLFRFVLFGGLDPYAGPLYRHQGDLWQASWGVRALWALRSTLLSFGGVASGGFGLSPEYCDVSVGLNGWFLLALLSLGGFVAWSWFAVRRAGKAGRLAVSGLIFYGITFLPTSNLVWMPNRRADRFAYWPSIGFVFLMVAVAWWVAAAARDWSAKQQDRLLGRVPVWAWATAFVLPFVVWWTAGLQSTLEQYRNDPILWQVAARKAPCQPRALVGHGEHRLQQHDVVSAKALADRALLLRPGFPPALLLEGSVALDRGDVRTALMWYRRALDYGYWQPWMCHLGMARAQVGLGHIRQARRQAAMARLLAPNRMAPYLVSADLVWLGPPGEERPAQVATWLAKGLGAVFR
ncbi:MAG: hypothetical protein J7M25_18180 [Deltaproteobacteria bacterium]|nr:hypothetical protein [Deltaproteobacteria bacterium]